MCCNCGFLSLSLTIVCRYGRVRLSVSVCPETTVRRLSEKAADGLIVREKRHGAVKSPCLLVELERDYLPVPEHFVPALAAVLFFAMTLLTMSGMATNSIVPPATSAV